MRELTQLTFDRQASTAAPPAEATRAWAATQHAFVSSLITDMPEERRAVRTAVLRVGAVPVMFEYELGAQDQPAENAYLDGVRQSGIYIGLFGPRYGVRLPSGRSATHDELVEAESLGLRLCLFTHGYGSDEMDRAQRDVIAGLQNLYTTSSYDGPADLQEKVEARIRQLASEALLPWVRIDDVLLRANAIAANGEIISVSAAVFDRKIFAQLRRLQDGRRADLAFATHLDAANVRVANVQTNITNAAFADLTISLERREVQASGLLRMSVNGLSADEIGRRSLADGLFGTHELPRDGLGLYRAVNPLGPLQGLKVPEAGIRPIAQLLLTEHLIREQLADAVSPLELGPSHQGRRALRLTWQPPRRYVNEALPAPITIAGEVEGL